MKSCSCNRIPARLGFSDPRFRRARLGDALTDAGGGATGPADQTFQQWLTQQPADTQALYYAYQAANPGSPVYNPDAPQSQTQLNTATTTGNWTLALGAGAVAFLLLTAITGGGGRRR
ncbi:MAG TPA: hypothetical protein VG297_24295 [Bryobacteraceae bacterium]|nr:hypothetical protein [Bryobacteraceae bacterium]